MPSMRYTTDISKNNSQLQVMRDKSKEEGDVSCVHIRQLRPFKKRKKDETIPNNESYPLDRFYDFTPLSLLDLIKIKTR